MKFGYAALMAGLFLSPFPGAAETASKHPSAAQASGISCADFQQLSNGAWTPIRKVTLTAPQGPITVEPGETFGIETGGNILNLKIARILNDKCR
ncbi:MAG: hypothetical protein WB816_10880 [Methylocystis sp.]